MDYRKMMRAHLKADAKLTIATIPVTAEDATGFGIMKTNNQGLITDFIEKPAVELLPDWQSDVPDEAKAGGKHYLASMGIYIFDFEVLESLIESNPGATDFGKEIIPKAIESDRKVASYKYTGYWTDIGTIRSFYEANLELTNPLPKFDMYAPEKKVFTRPRLLPPSKVYGTRMDSTLMAEGCVIEAESINRSIIGIRSRIGKNTVIKDSILMGLDRYSSLEEILDRQPDLPAPGIGQNCHIERAIIDKNARIGNNVRIIGGDHLENTENQNYTIVDGIIIVEKNGILPDGTSI
jgi:glucose-1-phosphate adenylyltransferase